MALCYGVFRTPIPLLRFSFLWGVGAFSQARQKAPTPSLFVAGYRQPMDIHPSYLLALASAACFSSASLIFAEVSRRVSSLWMNAIKAAVAWVFFGLAVGWLGWADIDAKVGLALLASGVLGLAVGDIFLLTAYARMGAARTLILFGFQPLFIGVAAHFLFGQEITWLRGLAVVFFLACLFVFSLERFRQDGRWEIYGLVAALVGVLFDNCGVLLTRWSFEQVTELNAFQANWIRCSGALIFFLLFGSVAKIELVKGWQQLQPKMRWLALFSSFLGTFMSLVLYLTAVKIGHLASLAALGLAGPLISSGLECAYNRKWPSRYLLVALFFFLCGFGILVGL
jgi:DME family drug/metabolite transporter